MIDGEVAVIKVTSTLMGATQPYTVHAAMFEVGPTLCRKKYPIRQKSSSTPSPSGRALSHRRYRKHVAHIFFSSYALTTMGLCEPWSSSLTYTNDILDNKGNSILLS